MLHRLFPNGKNWSFMKWLYPGMQVKRWLGLLVVGVILVALGLAYFLREIYDTVTFPAIVWYVTIQFLPRYIRGAFFIAIGVCLILFALWRFNRSILSVLRPSGQMDRLVNLVYKERQLSRGLKIVAIGGGTGLSILLKGLKEYTGNLTAIVTVADDGGSSGRLRQELGILPPGDIRNCIAALADAEGLMTKLMQYRFSEGSGLGGHSFGNLFIAAMMGVTGSFEEAVKESGRVLAIRGQVLPSTLENVTLLAHTEGEIIRGESNIGSSGKRIKRVFLEPEGAKAHPDAVDAIMESDIIILGPGSLYTSVIPNLLVDGLVRAIRRSKAAKVYVCNVATQPGETDGYSPADYVDALIRHTGPDLFDYVLINDKLINAHSNGQAETETFNGRTIEGVRVFTADVIDLENPLHHHPKKLSQAVLRLYDSHREVERKREELVEVVASR